MKKRILNIGCGNDTYGTDFVDVYPERPEVKKVQIDEEKLPYKDNTFDEVRMNYVFEHLRNPKFVLEEIYRVLKKGGKLHLETDNAGWFHFHNEKGWGEHYGGYNFEEHGDDDMHYGLFTTHHLENHLKKTGFKHFKVKLFQRDKLGWKLNLIHNILRKTRFWRITYPQLKAEAWK